MAIKIGSTDVANIKVGNANVDRVMIGSTVVWSSVTKGGRWSCVCGGESATLTGGRDIYHWLAYEISMFGGEVNLFLENKLDDTWKMAVSGTIPSGSVLVNSTINKSKGAKDLLFTLNIGGEKTFILNWSAS